MFYFWTTGIIAAFPSPLSNKMALCAPRCMLGTVRNNIYVDEMENRVQSLRTVLPSGAVLQAGFWRSRNRIGKAGDSELIQIKNQQKDSFVQGRPGVCYEHVGNKTKHYIANCLVHSFLAITVC